jgi:hypothetical protein
MADQGAPRADRLSPLTSDPVIEAYKKDVDRTLLRENLRLTIEERLRKLQRLQLAAEELARAGRRSGG